MFVNRVFGSFQKVQRFLLFNFGGVKKLLVHHPELLGPFLDDVESKNVGSRGPCQVILVHTNIIQVSELFGIFWVQLLMSHSPHFLNHLFFCRSDERIIEITKTEDDAP